MSFFSRFSLLSSLLLSTPFHIDENLLPSLLLSTPFHYWHRDTFIHQTPDQITQLGFIHHSFIHHSFIHQEFESTSLFFSVWTFFLIFIYWWKLFPFLSFLLYLSTPFHYWGNINNIIKKKNQYDSSRPKT